MQPNDFIAMRLPRRQAKQNALKFYMEDLEDVEDRSNSDDEVTFPHKRKLEHLLSESSNLPVKSSRLRKIQKNNLKSVSHGRQLLRSRLKFHRNLGSSDRRSTRSSSKSSDSNDSSDLRKNKPQDLSVQNVKTNNGKSQSSGPPPNRQQRVTRLTDSNPQPHSEGSSDQPKTRKNSGKYATIDLKFKATFRFYKTLFRSRLFKKSFIEFGNGMKLSNEMF